MNYHHLARPRMGPAAFLSAVLYPIQLALLLVSVAWFLFPSPISPIRLSKLESPPPIQILYSSLSQPLGAVPPIFSSAVPVPDGHRTSFTTLAIPVPSRCTRPLFGHGPSYKKSVRRPPDSQLRRQYPAAYTRPDISC